MQRVWNGSAVLMRGREVKMFFGKSLVSIPTRNRKGRMPITSAYKLCRTSRIVFTESDDHLIVRCFPALASLFYCKFQDVQYSVMEPKGTILACSGSQIFTSRI